MRFSIFEKFPELRYGISEKKDGSMNSPVTIDSHERRVTVEKNRRLFLERAGFHSDCAVSPYLIHGGDVIVVDNKNYKKLFRKDGFVTGEKEIILTVTVADCFPLYLYDPIRYVIGLVHAGWKGITKGIVEHAIDAFVSEFNSDPEDILFGIGPGIQKCHFEIRDDIRDTFEPYEPFVKIKEKGLYFINLQGIIIEKAITKGIRSIEAHPDCTYCKKEKYFSYRRDKPGQIPEVMLAHIGLI